MFVENPGQIRDVCHAVHHRAGDGEHRGAHADLATREILADQLLERGLAATRKHRLVDDRRCLTVIKSQSRVRSPDVPGQDEVAGAFVSHAGAETSTPYCDERARIRRTASVCWANVSLNVWRPSPRATKYR